MKTAIKLCQLSALTVIAIASTIPNAKAATDNTGQVLTLAPSADESTMTLLWVAASDDFGPRQPCNQKTYYIELKNDGIVVQTFNTSNSPLLTDASGFCYLQRIISSGAVYSTKVSPGVWTASVTSVGWPLTERRDIYACTVNQGKRPMYWTRNSAYTDNLYTLSASQRDSSLTIGYSNRGVPFAMPNQTRFGSAAFYRYYKGAPQFEHFYTSVAAEWRYVEQNGYTYEGIEGHIFKEPKPGSVALRRYALFNGANGDLQHYYTITPNDPYAAGWGSDGIVGYVCPP